MANSYSIGDKVRMKDNTAHYEFPRYYPDCTVIGKVLEVCKDTSNKDTLYVDWGKDSGVFELDGKCRWFVDKDLVVKMEG